MHTFLFILYRYSKLFKKHIILSSLRNNKSISSVKVESTTFQKTKN